jgi:hypothetical protein
LTGESVESDQGPIPVAEYVGAPRSV